jgi:hypothetical protein
MWARGWWAIFITKQFSQAAGVIENPSGCGFAQKPPSRDFPFAFWLQCNKDVVSHE